VRPLDRIVTFPSHVIAVVGNANLTTAVTIGNSTVSIAGCHEAEINSPSATFLVLLS